MRVQAKIDSQALLAQWDREIAANGYTCELTSFSDIPLPQNENAIPVEVFSRDVLEEQLACLQMGEEIQAFRPSAQPRPQTAGQAGTAQTHEILHRADYPGYH